MNKKIINKKTVTYYLLGFLAIPVLVFILFSPFHFLNQFEPNLYLEGKGTPQLEPSILRPFVCTQTLGMGEGSYDYYCSLPGLFTSTFKNLVTAGITFLLYVFYLGFGLLGLLAGLLPRNKKTFMTLIAIILGLILFSMIKFTPEPRVSDMGDYEIDSAYNQDGKFFMYQTYPEAWTVEKDEIIEDRIWVISPGGLVALYYPAESPEEYENIHKTEIQNGFMTIKETELTFYNTTYPAKEYSQHGEVIYLFQVEENNIAIRSEQYLNEDNIDDLKVIINSMKF